MTAMLEVGVPSCLNEGVERWREFKTSSEERQAALIPGGLDFATTYRKVPGLEVAREHALDLRTRFTETASPLAIAESFLEYYKVDIMYLPYSARGGARHPLSERSTVRALLMPNNPGDGFTVSINTDWSGYYREVFGHEHDAYAALIGHEVGHMFFFSKSGKPRQFISPDSNNNLEDWCDHFSLHWTGVDLGQKKIS